MQSPSEEQRDHLRSLTHLGRDLAGTLALDTAVERVVDVVTQLIHPDHLLIVLHHPETHIPFVAHSYHYARPRPDDPLIELVINDGPRVLVHATPEELAHMQVRPAVSLGSWVGAPILARGKPIGAISATSQTPGQLTETHLGLLSVVTAQLGIALENIRLLQLLSAGKLEWEQTVDAISQAFCLVDRKELIRRANRAFAKMVDQPLTALSGQRWPAVLPPEWKSAIEQAIGSAGANRQFDLKTGKRLYTVTALPLVQPEGTVVLVFDDQTEKHKLQEQLIQTAKMSAIGQLIAGVAHDLNNPLASVIGFSDFLIESTDVPENLRGPLEAIRGEAERAAKIVRSLLTFARKHEGAREPRPIAPLLETTLVLLKNELTAGKIETEVVIADGLPHVDIDANRLEQVFVNLVHNAAQAMQSSGVGDRIDISVEPWLKGVVVSFADNGPGIPPDTAEHIFEPFFTTKAEGEGTGLGLSICQGILTEHGGRITYESARGGGAIFRVELPAGGVPVAETPAAPVDPGTLRILVVDDEPHIQHYMRATLEAWGHTVSVASDGSEAFAKVTAEPFDVIITDLRMPKRGGREFYEELCSREPDVARRVVFSTGDTVRGDTLEFLESEGRPYLRKPFTLAELRSALAQAAG